MPCESMKKKHSCSDTKVQGKAREEYICQQINQT